MALSLTAQAFLGLTFGGIAAIAVVACEPRTGLTAPATPTTSAKGEAEADPVRMSPAPSTPAPNPVGSSASEIAPASTLFVSDNAVDCEGEGPRKCLRVRTSETNPWVLFYGAIEGFAHEDGISYELRVAITDRDRPPADTPAKRYRLVQIVAKRKVAPPPVGN